jgi:hypothetical protein
MAIIITEAPSSKWSVEFDLLQFPKEHGKPVQLQFAHGMRGLMDEPPPDTN